MNILLIGAGRMATGVLFDMLLDKNIERVTVLDRCEESLRALKERFDDRRIEIQKADIEDVGSLSSSVRGRDCVVNATHYKYNYDLSRLCIENGTNFCDMGGNIGVVEKQLSLDGRAKEKNVTIIPDCGLAPGMVSIATVYFMEGFDDVESVRIRVGGVPQKPKTALNYQLVFSVEGLINEYIEKAEIVKDGRVQYVDPMTEIEKINFPKPFGEMEAFYTSGGSSTLTRTLKGKVNNLDYKTIRYPGHCELFKILLDIGMAKSEEMTIDGVKVVPRKLLGRLLESYLPCNEPDAVIVRIEIKGKKGKKNLKKTYDLIDRYDEKNDLSSMQRTTAFPVSIIAKMLAFEKVTQKGVIPQELCVPPMEFMSELEKRKIRFKEV